MGLVFVDWILLAIDWDKLRPVVCTEINCQVQHNVLSFSTTRETLSLSTRFLPHGDNCEDVTGAWNTLRNS